MRKRERERERDRERERESERGREGRKGDRQTRHDVNFGSMDDEQGVVQRSVRQHSGGVIAHGYVEFALTNANETRHTHQLQVSQI